MNIVRLSILMTLVFIFAPAPTRAIPAVINPEPQIGLSEENQAENGTVLKPEPKQDVKVGDGLPNEGDKVKGPEEGNKGDVVVEEEKQKGEDAEKEGGEVKKSGGGGGGVAKSAEEKVEKVDCSTQLCPELRNQFVETVESENCRSMFVSGKCTVGCLTGLKEVLGNSSWTGCTTQCAGGFAGGGAERYLDMCEARQGNLLDVGAEAVKSFVGPPKWTTFLVVVILAAGVMALRSSNRFRRWGKHARRRSGDSAQLLPSHSSHHRSQVSSVLV